MTSSKVESMNATINLSSFDASRISPLSSTGVENAIKIEEQRERKPKVHFEEAEPDNIDLSETQNATESVTSSTELLKENLQPEVMFLFALTYIYLQS